MPTIILPTIWLMSEPPDTTGQGSVLRVWGRIFPALKQSNDDVNEYLDKEKV